MLSSLSTSDQPGILKCTRAWCKTCPFICNVEIISGPKRSIKITVHFTCTSTNVIYCITCTLCKKLYIGETERQIGDDSEKTLVMLKETAKTHVNRELRSLRSPQVVLPQLKVISPQLKVISLPRPKVGLPEFFSYDLESKWLIWTKHVFTLRVKSHVFKYYRPSINQQTLFDFVVIRVQQYFWSMCVIKQIHLDSVAL